MKELSQKTAAFFARRRQLDAILILGLVAGTFWLARDSETPGAEKTSAAAAFTSLIPELQALAGEGDYLFFPSRRNIWVVNKKYGRILHYKFVDTTEVTVDRSHIGQVDQRVFPPEDTLYSLSDRNLTDFLWVCNQKTGDFQVWRRHVRDGRLVPDPDIISASQHLLNPVIPNRGKREKAQ